MRPKGRRRRRRTAHSTPRQNSFGKEAKTHLEQAKRDSTPVSLSLSLFPKMVPNAMPGWWYVLDLDVASATL